MASNPINATDPSGHKPCDYFDANGQCVEEPPPPTNSGAYHGSEVKALYDKMKDDKCGWWYDLGHLGQFTFEDFNGLMIIHEGAGYPPFEGYVAQAAAEQLYSGGFNPPYCPGSVCFDGALDFWAAVSESVHNLVNTYVRGNTPISEYYGYGEWARQPATIIYLANAPELGSDMLYPPDVSWDPSNGPSNWGNNPPWVDFMATHGASIGHGRTQIYYYSGDFLVFSVSQYDYWKSQGAPVDLPKSGANGL